MRAPGIFAPEAGASLAFEGSGLGAGGGGEGFDGFSLSCGAGGGGAASFLGASLGASSVFGCSAGFEDAGHKNQRSP